ncbi:Helix-turn-helix, AraC domain-containing protein [Desulfovibrio sp. X2]|nr:Helix-turn-helix, AraC domain-containing protein [Desulfovibrio sp. X2]
MDRDRPFTKYPHDARERVEVPMHTHTNGQLNYVGRGTVHLLSPEGCWIVPWRRLVWIPPDQSHSMRSPGLSGSWKVMVPRAYAAFLPKEIAVLRTDPLLLAALEALPEDGESLPPTRLGPLAEIIGQELAGAEQENFGVALPMSDRLREIAESLLRQPEDRRGLDAWASAAGMSRRTFTRRFMAETGSSFGAWRKDVLLAKAVSLLAEGQGIAEIADRLGYAYPSAFIAAFRRKYGTSPLRFKK